jgi:Flp pilus assembly pilin Flp
LFSALRRKLLVRSSEKAQGIIDYALILAFVAVIATAVFFGSNGRGMSFKNAVDVKYDKANSSIDLIKVPEGDSVDKQ